MPHELGKSMEWNRYCHTVAKAVTEVVRAHIMELRSFSIFLDEIA
jgi:hypothetical protein